MGHLVLVPHILNNSVLDPRIFEIAHKLHKSRRVLQFGSFMTKIPFPFLLQPPVAGLLLLILDTH